MSLPPSSSTPQFATAEYAGGGDVCKSCGQKISGQYYRVNGAVACDRCAEQAKAATPKDSHAAFVRAVLYGLGAAVLGMVGYAAFVIISHFSIGYVSLAVGWFIGVAMHKGSGGVGGRRYQIVAVALTYAAVSIAAVPISIAFRNEDRPAPSAKVYSSPSDSGQPSASQDSQQQPGNSEAEDKSEMTFAKAVGILLVIGLASPFLKFADPVHGILGLIILLVGMRFAWQKTAGKTNDIVGPFQAKAPEAAPST